MENSATKVVVWTACALVAASACASEGSGPPAANRDQPATLGGVDGGGPPVTTPIVRVTDYGEALRNASLKLVGELPALNDIKAIASAPSDAEKKRAYSAIVDRYVGDLRFSEQQIAWWRNTFKTGDEPNLPDDLPSMDTAATFAAQVVVQDRPYTDLLTATTGTCPTYAAGTFTPANCVTDAPVTGVLTDPGLMAQYASNMAFRRVRFIQETFGCSKFPAEVKPEASPMGGGLYTSPWAFESIAGGAGAKIDFHDTSAVVCANCHTTMNHIAPLFATFDAKGVYRPTIQVDTPVTPAVKTVLADWLPPGQKLAWRNGVEVTDLPSLGTALTKDPDVLRCAVVRVWNWGLSRGDVVNDGATVPPAVIADEVAAFIADGLKLKRVIQRVFTSESFVQF